MTGKPKYSTPALSAGIELMRVLCEHPKPMGVTELAAAAGLNTHMAFRCLKTLQAAGYITEKEGQKYEPSLLPFHYYAMPVARMSLVRAAEEPLRRLGDETCETVYLGILDDTRVMYVLLYEGTREIRVGGGCIGGRYFLHADAAGKVLAAYAGEPLWKRLLKEGLEKLTPQTHATAITFRAEMKQVQQQGWAEEHGEYIPGIQCIAAPVFDYRGAILGAVSCSVLAMHYTDAEFTGTIGKKIKACAREISLALGYQEAANA